MRVFQKRETLVQNIAFLGIMSAINVVLLLVSTFLTYLLLLLTIVLPFVSLLVTIFCEKKYYPIYVVATIGLSFIVSINAISNILFYILPGVLSGFIFGFCLEKEIPSNYSILYSSFVYVVCSYLCLIICDTLLNQPIEELYFSILDLDDFVWRGYIIAPFIFAIGIIQSSLSYLLIQKEIKKLGIDENEIDDNFDTIFLFIFILLSLVSFFVKPEAYLMFVGFTIYEFIHLEKNIFRSAKKLFVVTLGVTFFGTILSFAIGYNKIPTYSCVLLLLIPIFIVGIIAFVKQFVKVRR